VRNLSKFAAVLLGVVAVASIGSHWVFTASAESARKRVEAALDREQISSAELRQDVAYLRHLLENVHPAEVPSNPVGDYRPALDALEASLTGPLDHLGFYRLLAPVANLLNDEHTMVYPSERDRDRFAGADARLLPFDVEIFDNRLYVASSPGDGFELHSGDELLSVNGQSADSMIATLTRYYSGTGARQKQVYASHDLRAALPLVLEIHEPFQIDVRHRETGAVVQYVLEGARRPRPVRDDFRFELIAPGTMLFTWLAFEDEDDRFGDFLEEMFSVARDSNIRALIIDIRQNRGGAAACGDAVLAYLAESPFTQLQNVEVTVSEEVRAEFRSYIPALLRWLPLQYVHPLLRPLWTADPGQTVVVETDFVGRSPDAPEFDGDVYLLTGPGTMSSASLFAATMKKLDLVTIVGEETGGYATMYGNVIDARLPNSGLKVWIPTSVVAGHEEGPVVPDVRVSQADGDLAELRDAVLDAATDLASRRQGNR
jgi:C-terminal processing protease CtpA/Prc